METTTARAGAAATATRSPHRFAVVLDADRPQLVRAAVAAYGGLFGEDDPVELAIVVRGGFETHAPERVTAVVQELCREAGVEGEVIAYEPHEAETLAVDVAAGIAGEKDRAAELARWLSVLADAYGELHGDDPRDPLGVDPGALARAAREDLARVFSDIYRTTAARSPACPAPAPDRSWSTHCR
jgi:hypothetical protein